jgi:hypothetical protein
MTKEYPYVPRVAFATNRDFEAHIVCGNGAHYLWNDGQQQWVELAPVPDSARAKYFEQTAEREAQEVISKKRQEQARIAAESAHEEYEQRRQIGLQKQAKMREMMTLEAFVVGVVREEHFFMAEGGFFFPKARKQGVTKNTIVRDVLQSSRNKWDAEQITQCLTDLVNSGVIKETSKQNNASFKPYFLYRLADKLTAEDAGVAVLPFVPPQPRISV